MNGFEAIREIYNLKLEGIAELLGISKQSVSEWTRVGRSIPKKRVAELSIKLKIPEKYFSIEKVTERDKLEIKKYRLNKELEDTSFEYEDERQDNKGNWVTVPTVHVDAGLMEHIEYNDMDLKMDDLFKKEKDIINGYKPILDDEEWISANDDLAYMDRTISMFNRFADIMKDNNQIDILYNIMRAMELFFNVNVKKNQIWGEQSPFPTDLVNDEAKLVQKLVTVLQENYAEGQDRKKELQEEARWLAKNFSDDEEDLF